jgi:hypothetical protein
MMLSRLSIVIAMGNFGGRRPRHARMIDGDRAPDHIASTMPFRRERLWLRHRMVAIPALMVRGKASCRTMLTPRVTVPLSVVREPVVDAYFIPMAVMPVVIAMIIPSAIPVATVEAAPMPVEVIVQP